MEEAIKRARAVGFELPGTQNISDADLRRSFPNTILMSKSFWTALSTTEEWEAKPEGFNLQESMAKVAEGRLTYLQNWVRLISHIDAEGDVEEFFADLLKPIRK